MEANAYQNSKRRNSTARYFLKKCFASFLFVFVSFIAHFSMYFSLFIPENIRNCLHECIHTSFWEAMNCSAKLHCLFFSSNEPFGARALQRKSTPSVLSLSLYEASSIPQGREFTKWVLFTFSFFFIQYWESNPGPCTC